MYWINNSDPQRPQFSTYLQWLKGPAANVLVPDTTARNQGSCGVHILTVYIIFKAVVNIKVTKVSYRTTLALTTQVLIKLKYLSVSSQPFGTNGIVLTFWLIHITGPWAFEGSPHIFLRIYMDYSGCFVSVSWEGQDCRVICACTAPATIHQMIYGSLLPLMDITSRLGNASRWPGCGRDRKLWTTLALLIIWALS